MTTCNPQIQDQNRGRVLGMGLEASLCAGVASSGYYVRTARSATAIELAGFIDELPAPEG
jgi:hypothetical protein